MPNPELTEMEYLSQLMKELNYQPTGIIMYGLANSSMRQQLIKSLEEYKSSLSRENAHLYDLTIC